MTIPGLEIASFSDHGLTHAADCLQLFLPESSGTGSHRLERRIGVAEGRLLICPSDELQAHLMLNRILKTEQRLISCT